MIQCFKGLKVATRPRIGHPFKDGTGPPPCGFPYHRKSICPHCLQVSKEMHTFVLEF